MQEPIMNSQPAFPNDYSLIAATKPSPVAGLNSPIIMEQFAKRMSLLEALWSNTTFENQPPKPSRSNVIKSASNEALNSAGIIGIERIIPAYSASGTVAEGGAKFDNQKWSIIIDRDLLDKTKLAPGDIGGRQLAVPFEGRTMTQGLANIIYHEMRHAEQWFRMAQLLANTPLKDGTKRTAIQISKELKIPPEIAQKAIDTPLKKEQIADAKKWYESIVVNKSKRNDIILKINKGDNSPATRAAYRQLPEEADAFKTGDKLQDTYQRAANKKALEKQTSAAHFEQPLPTASQSNHLAAELSIAAQRYQAIAELLKEAGLQEGNSDWNKAVVQVAIGTKIDLADVKDIAKETPGITSNQAEKLVDSLNKSAQQER
jgi:hypothetical protein